MEIRLILLGVIALNGRGGMKCCDSLRAVFGKAQLNLRIYFMEIVKPNAYLVGSLNIPAEIMVISENIGNII